MTGFKDLLVVADDSKSCVTRLDVAVQVANRFGTHLTGLYVNQPVMIPAYIRAELAGSIDCLDCTAFFNSMSVSVWVSPVGLLRNLMTKK